MAFLCVTQLSNVHVPLLELMLLTFCLSFYSHSRFFFCFFVYQNMPYTPDDNAIHVWMEYCDGGDLRKVQCITTIIDTGFQAHRLL